MTEAIGLALLLAYQAALVDAVQRQAVVVYEKSRRIGVTWAMAAVAVLHAAGAKAAGGMNVYYMGYNQEMARDFISACGFWAKVLNLAASDMGEVLLKDEEKDVLAFRIQFASGFEIVALPSAPRVLRGKQGLVILDEAAFHDDLEEVLKAALALLMWGGKVVVISTHDGETNPFNTLVNDIRAGRLEYYLLRTTFDDALKDGLYHRICETTDQSWTAEGEAAWRDKIVKFYGTGADEELFVIPRQGSGVYLSAGLVEARLDPTIPVVRWSAPDEFKFWPDHLRTAEARAFCERELQPLLLVLDPGLRSYFGEDFGRSGDGTGIMPFQMLSNMVRRAAFLVELRNIPFDQQREVLYFIVDRLPRFTAGALDAGGNGAYLAEKAAQRYGAARIHEVHLSQPWYRDNMPPYKAAFEDGSILLPKHDDVAADHRLIRMEKGIAQIPEQRIKGADGLKRHGESAIAGVLGYFATRIAVTPMEFHALNRARITTALGDFQGG